MAHSTATQTNFDALIEQDNDAKAGRPRSEQSRKAILDSTRRLLSKTPLAGLSIEAIAKKAGVGKTTIYRWWPNKAAVAMDVFLALTPAQDAPAVTEPAAALKGQIEALITQLRGLNGRIIAGIIAESQADATVLDLLYEKFLKSRVEFMYAQIEAGMKDGSFRADLRPDIALDMMVGPVFLRILSGEHGMDDDFAAHYPAQALRALKA